MKSLWMLLLTVGLVVAGCSDDDPVRPTNLPVTGQVIDGSGEVVVGAAVIVTYELPVAAAVGNPDKPRTMINFVLPEAGPARLWLTSACEGEVVRTLVDDVVDAGQLSFIWDALDEDGLLVTSGVYQYHLEAGGETTSADLVLLINDYDPAADPALYRRHGVTGDEGRFSIDQKCLPFGYEAVAYDETGAEIGIYTINRRIQLHVLHGDHPTGVSGWVTVDVATGADVMVTLGK
jgi:hypothetical protein